MAKNEWKVEAATSEKPKGKKRKQPTEETVEAEKIYLSENNFSFLNKKESRKDNNQSRKASKRKSQSDTTKTKKPKTETTSSHEKTNSDDEFHEPTIEELKESEKPENVLSIETIRQKKKKSHHQNIATKLENSASRETEKNEQYLTRWQNDRSRWKFEKLRQISIQTTILDNTRISDEIFPIALDYLSGTKGAARDVVVKQAEDEINKLDGEIEKSQNKDDVTKMSRYKRARELLQLLQ